MTPQMGCMGVEDPVGLFGRTSRLWQMRLEAVRTPFAVVDAVLDPAEVEEQVMHAGASLCTFIGIVRDNTAGEPASHLEYEAYVPMAEAELGRIGAEAAARWPGSRMAIWHRLGSLEIGEASVVVAGAALSDGDAIAACHWAIDELKGRVPIWKKEFRPGGSFWIEGPTAHRS
ncbi:molybdenum cofactor biosynthesis protein MoaE [Candidatus Nephthysia bennettiae]